MNTELYQKLFDAGEMLKRINELISNRDRWQEELTKRQDRAEHSGAGLGFGLCILGLVVILFILIPMLFDYSPSTKGIFWAFFFVAFIPLLIGTFLSGRYFFSKSIKEKEQAGIREAENKINTLNDEINRTYDFQKLEFIPEGYRFDVAINYMAKMVYDDRADTLRNALDRFDEQMHRWKMENAQEEFLKIQALQLKQLNDLKAISFSTGVGVWMNN